MKQKKSDPRDAIVPMKPANIQDPTSHDRHHISKSVDPLDVKSKCPNEWTLNFSMLYNVNLTLYKFLYRKCLFDVQKHLIYRFYCTA